MIKQPRKTEENILETKENNKLGKPMKNNRKNKFSSFPKGIPFGFPESTPFVFQPLNSVFPKEN